MTSKPDLYPLVFTCNADSGKTGASYLMVQYFRNYIVRPSGSLSATSTIDSLSSSYICTANEANILVPPPYSRAASPDLPANNNGHEYSSISRSASQQGCSFGHYSYRPVPAVFATSDDSTITTNNQPHHRNSHHYDRRATGGGGGGSAGQMRTSESVNFQRLNNSSSHNALESSANMNMSHSEQQFRYNANSCSNLNSNSGGGGAGNKVIGIANANSLNLEIITNKANHAMQLFDSDNGHDLTTNAIGLDGSAGRDRGNHMARDTFDSSRCASTAAKRGSNCQTHHYHHQQEHHHGGGGGGSASAGGSIGDGNDSSARCQMLPHTQQFSEESPVINVDVLKKYESMRSYLNSMTGSAVSSLTNIDFPASPPQATSPTGEVKELLEQIRQLQKDSSTDGLADTSRCSQDLAQCSDAEYSASNDGGINGVGHSGQTKRPSTLQQQHHALQQRKSSSRSRYFPISATRSICSPIGSNSWLGGFGRGHKRWISRSAPSTPDTGLLPGFLQDHSPLLNEHDEENDQNT